MPNARRCLIFVEMAAISLEIYIGSGACIDKNAV